MKAIIPVSPFRLISPRARARFLAALSLSASTAVFAQSWDGGGVDNNWSTAANWLSNVAPVANDPLTFTGATRLAAVNDYTVATTFGGLTFSKSAGAFTLTGNSLTLGGNITQNSLNAQSVANALILSASREVNVAERNGAMTLSGVISGTGFGLTKTGSGLLTLTGANTFTGGLTLSGGTTNVGGFGASGTNGGNGTVNFDGGALRYSGGGNVSAAVFVINAGKTATLDTGNGTGGGGTTFNYSGAIASTTGGLTKTGVGTLTLSGTNAYTGATTVNQGTLALNFGATGGTTNTDIVNSSSALVLGGDRTSLATPTNVINGATLAVTGKASTVTSQTFNGVTLKQGVNAISVNNTGTSTTLALGAITQENGGFVNFTNTGGTITTSTANTNGIIGGFATIGGITAGNWAANDGSGNIVAYSGYAVTGTTSGYGTASAPTIASDSTANVKIDSTSTVALTSGSTTNGSATVTVASTAGLVVGQVITGTGIPAGRTVASITDGTTFVLSGTASATGSGLALTAIPNITMAASGTTDVNTIQSTDTNARTITIGAGNTLRLGAEGGIWKAANNGNALTIGASGIGTLTAGGADNTAGEITLYANATNATTNSIIINSIIANNGTGVVSLTKNGLGSVDITQANTFTGNFYINEGRVAGSNATSYGQNNTVYIQSGGQAFLSGGATYANNFVISGTTSVTDTASFGAIRVGNNVTTVGSSSSTITLAGDARIGRNNDTTVATLAGKLTGNFNLELTAAGQSTDANRNVFLVTNTGNDMGGNLGINAINLGAGQTAAANGNTSVQVRLGASEVIAHGAGKGNVYIGGSTTGGNNSYLDLNGFNETINGLVSVGTAAQTRVTNGRSGTPAAATLTLGAGDATASFGGIIENGTGTLGLRKIGLGTQTLAGLNTYTGGTRVSEGILNYTANFTMSGANRMDIAAAGVAGVNYGTLTSSTGTVTFGGTLEINITTSLVGNQTFNLFQATGGALAGDFSNVSISGSYVNAGLTNNSGTWTGSAGGVDFSFVSATGILSTTAVPEPATYAAILGALVLIGAVIRRRRHGSTVTQSV